MKALHYSIIIGIGIGIVMTVIGNSQLSFAQDVIDGGQRTYNIYKTPLKQVESGVSASDVKCAPSLQLVIKAEDGSPACVKPDTASILMKRGWTKEIVTPKSQNTTLPASFMPCDTPYHKSNNGIPVLYMPINSVGKLCVKYYNGNDFPSTISQLGIFDPNNNYKSPPNITIWSDWENTTISKGNFTAVYWIKTGNQTGLYGLSVPSCTGTPFAVGYDNNSRITASDFPWIGTSSCAVISYSSDIDSMTGIGVKHITYP